MFSLHRGNGSTLTDQVCAGVCQQIDTHRLLEGSRLPSVRKLAGKLGVSVFTISTAYERLVSQGVLMARTGSGYFVAQRRQGTATGGSNVQAMTICKPINAISFVLNDLAGERYDVPAGSGFLPCNWLENAIPPSVVGRLLRSEVSCSAPVPAQGLPLLRQQLATKLHHDGINADANQIVVTYGATHAMGLVCDVLVKPGDVIFVEDPGNMVQHELLARTGAKIVSIPRTASGPDLDQLDELARRHSPKLFFMQTLLQNPTGSSTTPALCFRLLSLAEKHDFHIVEDDVYGDMCVNKPLRLASMDDFQRVIYVNSFTKVLSPALRVGYVVAHPKFVTRLVERKVLSVLNGSSLQESLVAHALQSGRYQAHLNLLNTRLLQARTSAEQALSGIGMVFDHQAMDGMFLWGRVPHGVDVDKLIDNALESRIFLSKGSLFSPSGSYSRHLRFNAAYGSAPQLLDCLRGALAGREPAARPECHFPLRPMQNQGSTTLRG